MTYRHQEALALMWYACRCGHRERIWNSRDGVTPFSLQCPSCGQLSLAHVDWRLDEARPDHRLHPRQRFWRDGTPAEAERLMEKRIAGFLAKGHEIPDEAAERLRASVRDGTSMEFQPGWPRLDQQP